MRILVTGTTGQVGYELLRAFEPPVEVIAAPRSRMDLLNPDSIRQCLRDAQPDVIINAAAYTAVDRAEQEPETAMAINGRAVGILGEEARRLGAAIIHYSTDYVFDGNKRSPYTPEDSPNPLSAYGRSKLAGEQSLIASGAKFIILRTCWVYGMRGRNFVLAILRQAAHRPELRIVNDQIGSPTWCRVIAQATAQIATEAIVGTHSDRSFGGKEGVYHYACGGCTSWYDFARRVFELAALPRTPALVPITTAAFGARAQRPSFSALDSRKTVNAFGVPIVDWSAALEEAMSEASDGLVALIRAGDAE